MNLTEPNWTETKTLCAKRRQF